MAYPSLGVLRLLMGWQQMSTILFVDDETFITDQFEVAVQFHARENKSTPHTVVAKATGPDALSYIDGVEQSLDCLITDYRISPDFTGLDLIRYFRASRRDLDIPCFMVTGQAGDSDEVAAEATELGVVRYVRKPLAAAALLEAIDDALQLYEARRSLEKFRKTTVAITSCIHSALQVGTSNRVEDLAAVAATTLREVAEADAVIVLLRAQGEAVLNLVAVEGIDGTIDNKIPIGKGLAGQAAMSGQRLSVLAQPSISSELSFENRAGSITYLPLRDRASESIIGVVGIINSQPTELPSHLERAMAALGELLSFAFSENMRGSTMDQVLVSALKSVADREDDAEDGEVSNDLLNIQLVAQQATSDPLEKERMQLAALVRSLSEKSSGGLHAAIDIIDAVVGLLDSRASF